jgi:hypothetical protein
MCDPGLLHDRVSGMARQYLGIDGKIAIGDRAEPDFVVTLALPDDATFVFAKYASPRG